jgi:hypothetical protein
MVADTGSRGLAMKENRNKYIFAVTVMMLALTISIPTQARDYYVDQNHSAADDSNAGTMDHPWKTIKKANATLVAGDVVYIKRGTYTSYIAPAHSGTSEKRITYRNYGTDVVTIRDAPLGISLDGNDYITVQGINFTNLDKFLWLQNGANYNIIAYCNFDQARTVGWSGSKIYENSSYNWVHHCRFSKYGVQINDDVGTLIDIGNEDSITDLTRYNLLENNTLYHAAHHLMGVFGMFNVIRNNRFHHERWTGSGPFGGRNLMLAGYSVNSGWNLIEGNDIGYSAPPADAWGAAGMGLTTGYNIIRKNRFFYNDLAGIAMTLAIEYVADIVHNKIYQNTFMRNGWNPNRPDAMTSAIGMERYAGSKIIKYNDIKNNLYYSHFQVYGVGKGVSLDDLTVSGNYNGDASGDPLFVNATTTPGDPMDSSYPDLHLRSGSPAIDAGTYLTRVVSAGGSGSSIQVEDSRYFMDGWGIVAGDRIQLFGTSQKATVTAIDYATNTLTVDTPLTWKQHQGVSLVYEGAAPDAGAYETNEAAPLKVPVPPQNLSIKKRSS